MAIERGAGAVKTQTKKKKKKDTTQTQKANNSLPKVSSVKQTKKKAQKQYEEYKNVYQPKVSKASTASQQTSLQKAQTAFNKGQEAKSTQKGKVTTSHFGQITQKKIDKSEEKAKKKFGVGTYSTQNATKASKVGLQTTGLGTKQEKKTTNIISPVKKVQETVKQTADFYGSDDWKNIKSNLKVKNQEGWRKALSNQGWTRKQIDDWMESEEGKAERKRTYMESKKATKDYINNEIKKGVNKSNTLESVNALTNQEFQQMQTASKMGKTQGNKYLKSVGGKDLQYKIGSKNAQSAYESPFATGAMQGASYVDLFSGSVGKYNEGAKSAIEATKGKGSYMAGYGVGLAAQMGVGQVGKMGASLAEGVGKSVAKLAGKGAYKEVSEEVAEEALKEYGKISGKQGLARFAKNRAGELGAETPVNILDAAKMSMDADGNLNKDEFKKWLIINSAFTFGVGGAMEGIGAGATRKLGNETLELMAKKESGQITPEELKQLDKNIEKLAKKREGYNMSSDIANARMENIEHRSAKQKAKKYTEMNESSYAPGRNKGVKKGKYNYEASQKRYAQAKKIKEGEERVAKVAEAKEAKARAQKHAEGAEASAKRSIQNEVVRLQDKAQKIREALVKAQKAVEKDNTMGGHALAVARKEELEKALKITEEQLARVERGTVKGRLQQNAKALAKDNTLAGHEVAARERDAIRAELKANSDKAFSDLTDAEKALEKEDLDTIQAMQKYDSRIKEINDEIASLSEWQKTLKGDEEEFSQITARRKELNKERKQLKKELKELQSAPPRNEAKAEAPKPKAEAPKAEAKAERPEGGFATFGKEEDQAELAQAGLDREAKPSKQGLELKPKEGQSTYEAHIENENNVRAKETENKNRVEKGKAETEAKEHKSLFHTFVQKFVSDLEPFERMAMEGATREERKRGRTTINGMLTARSKAMTKVRNEGMQIFEKRGLHKDAKKAKAFDTYALMKHDLERLKQKSIIVFKNGKQYNIDFGEGTVLTPAGKGEDAIWKTSKDLPIDAKEWRNLKNKSEDEIKAYVEKYVKDNDLEWNQLINNKSFSGYDEKTINGILSDLEKQYGKDIEEFQQELVNYHHDLLKEDLAGGIISKDRYLKLYSKYKNYVPTFRDYDAISARSFNEDFRAANLYNIEAKPFGSRGTSEIIPQYTQMIAKTNAVMKRVAENEMLNAISKINHIPIEQLPHGHTPDELIEVSSGVYKSQVKGEHRIFFRVDGKGVSMPISEDAYHAIRRWSGAERAALMELKLMNTKGAKLAAKGVTEASRAFKALITDYSLIFGARNLVRDTATALVYSEHPAQWLTHLPKAAMAIVKKDSPYHAMMEQYIKDGGRYNALVTSTDLGKMPKLGKKEGIPGLRVIKDFNTAMETLPRMSEYIATVERLAKEERFQKNGKPLTMEQALKNREITQEAMYNAKEVTLNFDRKGQYGAMLNRGLVPFFNPSVQGIDKLRRFLYADNKSMAEFGAMLGKMGGMVVAPTLAWEYLVNQENNIFKNDPRFEGMGEAYRKLSAYNKYAYFCIPMGKDENGDWEFLKIPRAREMASMQLPLDWAIQNIKYQNRDGTANLFESAKQAGRLAIDQIGPVNPLTDNYFSPIWRLKNNETWMGGRIEGYEDEDKRKQGNVSDIYDSSTSSAAVTLASLMNAGANKTLERLGVGKDVTRWVKQHEISPKQLDNLFDSYLGVIHDMGIRPFSQQGASLKSVTENPAEELKQWAQTTFGTAFVVNGTLSSQRKSGMYSELYDLKDKLKDYPKGSKEYGEANAKLAEFQNNCVYDVQSLDTAIDAINRSKKYTGREKAELTKAIKREQNLIIDDYNNGSKTVHDPLKAMMDLKDENGKRVFSDDYIFNNLTYTSDKGANKIKSSWNALKESDYYKEHPKKAVKDFKDVTFGVREMSGKMSDSKSYIDYASMAIFCEDKKAKKGKDYSTVLDAYGINDKSKKLADGYVNQMGGSADTYVASHGRLVKGARELGYNYVSDLPSHTCTMILAESETKNGNKLKDRAYWVEQNKYGSNSYVYQRMNYGRCLESDKYAESNWTSKKIDKFATKYELSYDSSDEKIANAINAKYPDKTDEEKAAIFGVIKPDGENPFGEVGDYSVKGDTGAPGSSKGGHGYGGRRRHRGGGGSSGGGATYTPIVTEASSHKSSAKLTKLKVTNTSKKNHTTKSNLNDAYRKQLKKLREQTRK